MHGAIMAALYAREKTGEGQKIDGSLFETQVALLTNVGLSWLNLGVEAERWGAQHPSGPNPCPCDSSTMLTQGSCTIRRFQNEGPVLRLRRDKR